MNKTNKPGIVMKIYRISHFLHNHHIKLLPKLFYAMNYVLFSSVIPPQVKIGKGSRIAHGVGIVIHPSADIGSDCIIYQNVTIANKDVKVGNGVLLGAGSVILGPAKIGNNVKIGANTVVNFDVPDNCTVVGQLGHIINKN